MRVVRSVLESAAWLLVPGPKEEGRGAEGTVTSLLFAGLIALNLLFPASPFRQFGGHQGTGLVLVAVLLLSAVLHASPPGWRRARLGARVLLTLAAVAFVMWFGAASVGLGPLGVGASALLVLALFSFSYHVNVRRALRSLSPPTD